MATQLANSSRTDALILRNYERFARRIWPEIDWEKLFAPDTNRSMPPKRDDHRNRGGFGGAGH